jgi:hypothetical protein
MHNPPPIVRMLLSKNPARVFTNAVIGSCWSLCCYILNTIAAIILIIIVASLFMFFLDMLSYLSDSLSVLLKCESAEGSTEGSAEGSTSKGSCSICYEDMVKECTELSCGHVFHRNCADTWHNINPSCALCRHEIVYNS